MEWISAPEILSGRATKSSKSTSSDKFIFEVIVEKTKRWINISHLYDSWYDSYLLTAIWEREFNFSVETTWSKKGWIQSVLSIGSHDNFYVHWLVETIHLIQKFEKDTLNFTIGTCLSVKTFGCNCINFINENNWRRVFWKKFSNRLWLDNDFGQWNPSIERLDLSMGWVKSKVDGPGSWKWTARGDRPF